MELINKLIADYRGLQGTKMMMTKLSQFDQLKYVPSAALYKQYTQTNEQLRKMLLRAITEERKKHKLNLSGCL